MFGLLYASLKYFTFGLVIGLLTAPRPGGESRRMLLEKGRRAISSVTPFTGANRRQGFERPSPEDSVTGSALEG